MIHTLSSPPMPMTEPEIAEISPRFTGKEGEKFKPIEVQAIIMDTVPRLFATISQLRAELEKVSGEFGRLAKLHATLTEALQVERDHSRWLSRIAYPGGPAGD